MYYNSQCDNFQILVWTEREREHNQDSWGLWGKNSFGPKCSPPPPKKNNRN